MEWKRRLKQYSIIIIHSVVMNIIVVFSLLPFAKMPLQNTNAIKYI